LGIDFVHSHLLTDISPAAAWNQSTNASAIKEGSMNKRYMVIPMLLVAVLAACGGNTVKPQDDGKGPGNTDTTAPTLTSSIPSNAASGIAVNAEIKLTFSEKMDAASVTVTSDPNSDLGEASWNAEANTVTFDPPANLETSSAYTLSISGKDFAGNALAATSVQFTTAGDSNPPPPVDTTAPRMVSSSPTNDASGIAINSNIAITFSEAMDPSSLAISITPNVNLGSASLRSGNATVEFNPPTDFSGDTTYTVNVSGKDVAGNALTGSSSFKFKTAITTVPDTTAPGVPQNVVAEAGDAQIKLTWNANTELDLKGYTIYYSNNASNLNLSVFVAKPGTSKTLTGLTNDQIYFYQLEAEDGAGNKSGRTITKNATPKKPTPTDLIAPATPQNLTFEAGQSQIKFSWTANTEADLKRYTLYYGTNASAISTPVFISKASTTYTLTGLTNGSIYYFQLEAEDTSGNRSGRTITKNASPSDLTAPKVISNFPANNDPNVSVNTLLKIIFDKAIDPTSLKVTGNCSGYGGPLLICSYDPTPVVFAAPTWSGDEKTVTFNNKTALEVQHVYTFKIDAKDKFGNALPTTTISFKTQLAQDFSSPTVTKIAPADPESGVMLNIPIAITFSEPMNLESLKTSFKANMAVFNGRFNPLIPSSVTVDPAGTNTYYFSVPLTYTAEVVWVLSANATDLAGNKLGANKLGHFYTIKKGTMEIISTKALDGYLGCCDTADGIPANGGYVERSSTIKVGYGTKSFLFKDDEVAIGFLSFDLSVLPGNVVEIFDSTLYLTTYRTIGTPFLEHGDLSLSRATYGNRLDLAAAFAYPEPCPSQTSCAVNVKSENESQFNVIGMMRQNWIDRLELGSRAQFALSFKFNSNKQGKDFIEYHSADSTTLSARPKLVITYLYP
jgi:methionine-rich copper-binding protein CopC